MKLTRPDGAHLTYCTNIHPGEEWAEVRANLLEYVVPVRKRVAPGVPFGLGLRLSGRAAEALGEPAALEELRGILEEHDLYVFTINGFPYGTFHGKPVKEAVYSPDWLEPERVRYTNQLADILAALLPGGLNGTISTVPGAFAPRIAYEADAAAVASAMASHVAKLVRLRRETGRHISLAIEPEPCCQLETIDQTVDFFERHLFGAAGKSALRRETGMSESEAESALREHVGVCYDICHMAVEFEDPARAITKLRASGIRIPKVQVSAGLRVVFDSDNAARFNALKAFAEDVYLHQVVELRRNGDIRRYVDLPDALEAAAKEPTAPAEWRIHFHVPLFHRDFGHFESTQAHVAEALGVLRGTECRHYEVETYTWHVLPPELRSVGIVEAVSRELEWTAARLAESGADQPGDDSR